MDSIKFAIGVCLDATPKDYSEIIDKYGKRIDSFYFSLPVSPLIQSRRKVARQFNDQIYVDRLWKILDILTDNNMKLDLVVNWNQANKEMMISMKSMLLDHDINVESVTTTDNNYDLVVEAFPDAEIIHSFNNFYTKKEDYYSITGYDKFILSHNSFQNVDLIKYMCSSGKKFAIIPNNGCSPNCCGCASNTCESVFQNNLLKSNIDELYAKQSLMPFEIYDNHFVWKNVNYFKLSTRSMSRQYFKACIESYFDNKNEELLINNSKLFHIWATLSWFYNNGDSLDFTRIMQLKKNNWFVSRDCL